MSSHRRPTLGFLTLIRVLLAIALSVAVLPFTAISSSADEEVVGEEIVDAEGVVVDEPAPLNEETPVEPPFEPLPLEQQEEPPAQDALPPDEARPTEPLEKSDLTSDASTARVASGSLMSALEDVVEPLVCLNGLVLGGFEIDGNLEACDFEDWDSTGVPDPVDDLFDDGSQFTEGSKEMDNPNTWVNGVGTSPGKDDIGDVYQYDKTVGGVIWSFFGFFRDANTGTTAYDIEYNQLRNAVGSNPTRPNRSAGDLLIQVTQEGNRTFAITDAFIWTVAEPGESLDKVCYTVPGYSPAAGWCPLAETSWAASFTGATGEDGFFAEGALNISALFGPGTCIGDFGTMNIRSRASDTPTSALKDWVGPLNVDIDGTCNDLIIEKLDARTGNLVGGSPLRFTISPDPRPGADNDPPVTVYVVDNEDADDISPEEAAAGQIPDADNTAGKIKITPVEPGEYTVTEVTPPTGYFLPPAPVGGVCPDATQDPLTVNCGVADATEGDGEIAFSDRKIWEAPSVSKTAAGSYGVSYSWTIEKTVSESDEEVAPDGSARLEVVDGSDATFYYNVKVTGTETETARTVTGAVTVVNPNDASMEVTLSDVLNNGTDATGQVSCTFTGDDGGSHEVTVPPTDEGDPGTSFDYTCSNLSAAQAAVLDRNTATVTWDLDEYAVDEPDTAGTQPATAASYADDFPTAHAAVAYSEGTVTDRTVSIEDEFPEFGGPRSVTFGTVTDNSTISLDGTVYTDSWTYQKTFSDIPQGTCTPYDNTAWVDLDEDREIDAQTGSVEPADTAVATVCSGSDLDVSKVTTTSLTRTYPYTIEKSAEAPRVDVDPATGDAVVEYTVVVTDGTCEGSAEEKTCTSYADSEWAMVSTVTLTNPNTWQSLQVTDIDDVYLADVGGNETEFDPACEPREDGPWTVPAATVTDGVKTSGQVTVILDCSFASQPPLNGTNRATATWSSTDVVTPGTSAFGTDPVVEAEWALSKVNDVVDVIDFLVDSEGVEILGTRESLGTVEWVDVGHEHTTDEVGNDGPHTGFTYTRTLQGVEGDCVTYDNRAQVMSQDDPPTPLDSDDASVDVCWMTDLNVTKNGAGTFHRDYDWDIEKWILVEENGQVIEVDEQTVNLDSPNVDHVFGYRVKAVPLPLSTDADSGWSVEGTITVDNPNSSEVESATEVTITELPDMGAGAVCDVVDGDYETLDGVNVKVEGGVVSVPAEDSVVVDYQCTFTSAPLGTKENLYDGNSNQVKITWGNDGVDLSEVKPVAFTLPDENRTDWVVEVHDDQLDPTLLDTVEYDASETARTFNYDLTHTGTEGNCTSFPNTATIERIGVSQVVEAAVSNVMAQASTTAEVCVQKPLQIVKDVTASYDRTYAWSIDKVASSGSVETSGGAASFRYDVTVAPNGSTDSGWVMGGTIDVTNPNSEAVGAITADVTDTTTVGGTCSVVNGNDVVIDPGETVPLTYSCTFTSKPTYTGGTNTARADWVGFEDDRFVVSDPVSVTFLLDQENYRYVSLTDAFDGGLPQPIAGATGIDWLAGAKTFTYSRSLGAPAGSCRTYPNTARIVETSQTDTASVTVCAEAGLQLSKTVSATFDRTYAWELEKLAGEPTGVGTGEETFEYTVTATPQVPADGVYDDSGFAMSGVITVTNPNAYAGGGITASVTDVPNVGAGVTCTVANGSSVQLAPGASVRLAYSCSFTGRPSYLGSNTANASWTGPDGAVRSASSGAAVVAFGIDDEVNKVIDLVDDKTQPGQAFDLGEAEWNAAGTPTSFSYSLDLTAEANECEEYTNTAEIVQTGDTADATVDVCGPEVLPDEVVVPEPQPRPEPVVKGVDTVIPDTGGPNAVLMWTGLALLLMGGVLLMTSRTRRSRT